MSSLVSRTRAIDSTLDLNAVARGDGYLFVRDGVGVAGRGIAHVADASTVREALASADTKDPGAPTAIGTLPFRRTDAARFVIPEILVRKSPSGETTLTLVGHHASDVDDSHFERVLADITRPQKPVVTAATFSVSPLTPVDTYLAAVAAARDAVRAGLIEKAVIARDISVTSDSPIDIYSVLLRLRASFGSSYRFAIDGFVGASPELLLSVHDDIVRSHPLAGTTPRTGDPITDERLARDLQASEKNQIEHRVVVDMVHDTLLPYCSYLDWEPEPSIVAVANVQHLGTAVEGRLASPAPHIVELARQLCPTPALSGAPHTAACELIDHVEGFSRGLYGGAVGWVDSSGNGTFAVAIRCAQFSEDRMQARLFAGGGIVGDSEPLSELAETQAKFQAMLSAIIRA